MGTYPRPTFGTALPPSGAAPPPCWGPGLPAARPPAARGCRDTGTEPCPPSPRSGPGGQIEPRPRLAYPGPGQERSQQRSQADEEEKVAAAERLHGCHPRGLRAARRLPPHRTAPPPAGLPGAPRTAGRSRPAPSPDVRPGPAAWRAPSPALPPASEEPGGKRPPAPLGTAGC